MMDVRDLIDEIKIISDDSRRLEEIIDAFRNMEKRCAAGPIPFTHSVQSDDYEALKRLIEEEE